MSRIKMAKRVFCAILFAITLFLLFSIFSVREGQVSHSPDGKYMVVVMKYVSPLFCKGYDVDVRNIHDNQITMRVLVRKINGNGCEHLRERESVVNWDMQGNYADINLPGSPTMRLFMHRGE